MQCNGSGQNGKFYSVSQRRDKNERCIIQFFSYSKNINLIIAKMLVK